MVNANEWLNKKIPANERGRAMILYIYSKCQCKIPQQYGQSMTIPQFSQSTTTPNFGHSVPTQPSLGPFGTTPFAPFAFSHSGPFGAAPFNPFPFGQSVPTSPPFCAPSVTTPYNSFGSSNHNYCQNCNNKDQNNSRTAPDYCFYNVILEGELDLNDLVNLQVLYIEGTEQNKNQLQKLTKLKIDKCIKLTEITINHTTLGYISLGSKPKLQRTNFTGNQQLIFCDSVLKNQIERLTNLIQATKTINLVNLKSELMKIEEENFVNQLNIIKSRLNEDYQVWLENLVEAHQEVLLINSSYARKQLEKCKKKLADVLTEEEIQDIMGKKVEINELETQLNKLSLNNEKTQINTTLIDLKKHS
ncbi:12836_t:CDS:2 [Cetraspora pellucida]|uniref:12836_t:CDS:1 n=1 Tax=Cetraspora pellucida TaxID=1433469 RepID=A0A9N9J905_9GLOM|nr:12836_t:CDS:2 [Cetraspora pellucida]